MKETVPNISPSPGPQDTISPLFRSSGLVARDFVLFELLQENSVNKNPANRIVVLIDKGYDQI